jgi:undecaprenyl diphosphate synthase
MRPSAPDSSLRIPRHVAIIMDGNGRWAAARGLPRTFGHRRGVDAVRGTVEAAADLGIGFLTLFGFSTENWSRPPTEITELMHLLRMYLRSHVAEMHQNGVRLRVIGDRDRLAEDIVDMIGHAECLTRDNCRLNLTVALSYGARQEIAAAARRLAEEVLSGGMAPQTIDEAAMSARLFTHDLPDPDLIVRTSGEKRVSNFLLWQAAYAELVFVDTLWPDFSRADLEHAIGEFQRRERRYGAIVGAE